MSKKKPLKTLTCLSCGEDHQTSRYRSTRCPTCTEQNLKTKALTCPACDTKFPKVDGHDFCRVCRTDDELVATTRAEVKEKLRKERFERDFSADKEEQRMRDAKKRRDAAKGQLAMLNNLGKLPKGYPEMTEETKSSAIGVLWLNLCATEGASRVLLNNRDVDDDTKQRMMTSYLRMTLKGYTPEAVSKVDPVALMRRDRDEMDKALTELPKVTEPEAADEFAFDPFEGVDDNLKNEVIALQEQREQCETAQRLGLAP